jgi:thioredoxin 1
MSRQKTPNIGEHPDTRLTTLGPRGSSPTPVPRISPIFKNPSLQENPTMSVDDLTAENFDSTITGNDIVVVDFWAPWCGPCRGFAPIFEQVAGETPDVKFVKVNTDEEQALAGHFGIRSIPTLMIFREQVIVFQQAGALPKSALADLIGQVGALDMAEVKRGAQRYDPDDGASALQ